MSDAQQTIAPTKLKGMRKAVVIGGLTLVTLAISTVFVWAGKMPSDQWVELAKWIVGTGVATFAVGNGIEHLKR